MAYKIGEFTFDEKEEAEIAKKEQQAVTYIRQNMDFSSPEKVLQIYRQIQEKELFHTVVGISFLEELQSYLVEENLIETESSKESQKESFGDNTRKNKKKNSRKKSFQKAILEKYKKRCGILRLLGVMLLMIVVGMFVVATTSNSPNILNYEEKIQNKYSGWEQELTQREKKLKQEQEKLTRRENALKKAEENQNP